MSATNSFKLYEYKGDDAADVLVTLIMNLRQVEVEVERGEEGDASDMKSRADLSEQTRPPVGFAPNSESEEGEREEEEEEPHGD